MDYISDQLYSGRAIRLLAIRDNYSCERLALKIGFRLSRNDVVEVLNELIEQRGIPHSLRVDNGPELTSRILDQWAYCQGVVLDFIRPDQPTDNAAMEASNSRFRQECLSEHWFLSVADAQVRVELWWNYYNSERPHSSLENLTPDDFASQSRALPSGMAQRAHRQQLDPINQTGNYALHNQKLLLPADQ